MNARNKLSLGSKALADLDPTFGDQGITILPIPADYNSTDVFGIATAPDDSIFASVICTPSSQFGIAKLRPDGALDTTFGDGGFQVDPEMGSFGAELKVLSDGRILACHRPAGIVTPRVLLRLTDRGAPDATFAAFGILPLEFGEHQLVDTDMIPLPDGGIVLMGGARHMEDGALLGGMIVRLREDGTLDPTLGGTGFVHVPFNTVPDEIKYAGVIQGDKYVLASTIGTKAVIRRYLPGGEQDMSFGVDGQYVASTGEGKAEFVDLLLSDKGRLVGVGNAIDESGHVYGFLVGIDAEGLPDTDFANGEPVYLRWLGSTDLKQAAFDDLGRIVLFGTFGSRYISNIVLVARYTDEGVLDESFGEGGYIAIIKPTGALEPRGLAIQGALGIVTSAWFQPTSVDPPESKHVFLMRMPHSPITRAP